MNTHWMTSRMMKRTAPMMGGVLLATVIGCGGTGAETATDTDGTTAGTDTAATAGTDAGTTAGTGSSGSDTGGDLQGCDYEALIQPIFTSNCALGGCHAGANPQMGMSLEAGVSYANIVGVDSGESPGTPRIAAGDPAGSYLWQKLGPAPAVGSQMPLGGELSAQDQARIEAWILAGAPETEPFQECDAGPGVAEVVIEEGPTSVQVGELVELTATALDGEGMPVDVAITWTSAQGEVLFIDRDGTGLGVSPGSVAVTAAVGNVVSPAVTVEVVDFDPPAAAFAADVLPIFTGVCAVPGCHVDGVEPGDMRFDREPMEVWERLVGNPVEEVPTMPRISPDDPLSSYLLLKLVQTTPQVGGQMPLGTAPIEAERAQAILRWILDGAPFN